MSAQVSPAARGQLVEDCRGCEGLAKPMLSARLAMPTCRDPLRQRVCEAQEVLVFLLGGAPGRLRDRDVDPVLEVRLCVDEGGNLARRKAEIPIDDADQLRLGLSLRGIAILADDGGVEAFQQPYAAVDGLGDRQVTRAFDPRIESAKDAPGAVTQVVVVPLKVT
ncbi:MAG: hypothetical protein JSR86_21960 [Proteobacteria bacterium]|nr:hypothetical protein [Pseudomonadota bacterium]